jgi:hypothetical protein
MGDHDAAASAGAGEGAGGDVRIFVSHASTDADTARRLCEHPRTGRLALLDRPARHQAGERLERGDPLRDRLVCLELDGSPWFSWTEDELLILVRGFRRTATGTR